MQEKMQEAAMLEAKLKEMELIEKNSRVELEKELAEVDSSQSTEQTENFGTAESIHSDSKPLKLIKQEELEEKKKELSTMEETVQRLENEWSSVQEESIKQPSPAQREKMLEKQLHSLVEQLTAKQAQAEGLANEIRVKERELEKLNGLRRRIDDGTSEATGAASRNRSSRNTSMSMDYSSDGASRRHGGSYAAFRTEGYKRLMLLRSAFVLYIFALHVIVFIKISFS